ncbi:MAG: Do family serine endopeptidase [Burkholderiales bacterium]
MQSNRILRAAVLAALLPAFAAGCTRTELPGLSSANAANPAAQMAPRATGTQMLPDFATLVEQNGAAVVAISVIKGAATEADAASGAPNLDPNDPLFEFFRRFGLPNPGGQRAPRGGGEEQAQGMGSGFIVGADGLIITNAHVVDGAKEVTVKLTDKREFKAKVLGSDKRTDVAVIKVDAKNLPVVKTGDPAQLRVGEWVAAIGSPFGFENTVTAGIVSAKSRAMEDGFVPFIQTDVAVNPGNSGGPLFNMAGEVVGINSMIYSRSGGYMGLSFAIPIDTALKVKDQLVAHGKVERGRIGVAVQEVTRDLADSFKLATPEGALIGGVEKGSPAERAGLKAGDVVLALDGKPVADASALARGIADRKPGDGVQLKVWRDGAAHEMTVKVGDTPGEKVATRGEAAPAGKLGVSVRELTDAERRQSGAEGGVLVEQVAGAAAKAGVQPGDVIVGVGSERVNTVDELKRAVDRSGKVVALRVQRGKAERFVPVPVG